MYTYIYIHIYIDTYVFIDMYIYIYPYTEICIYIYIHTYVRIEPFCFHLNKPHKKCMSLTRKKTWVETSTCLKRVFFAQHFP